MKINRSIIFFDLETTGTDTGKDRIVQISIKKLNTDHTQQITTFLINPEIPIPPGATEVHKITDEMVKDAKPFRNYARAIYKFMYGCDLSGFNSNKFDIPLLMEEMERAGQIFLDWDYNFVDVFLLHCILNPRTLSDLFKEYTGREMQNAHDAQGDVEATEIILAHILEKHFKEDTTPQELDEFCQGEKKRFDIAGKMYVNEAAEIIWNAGKYAGTLVKDTPKNYVDWALSDDKFLPSESKRKLKEIHTKK